MSKAIPVVSIAPDGTVTHYPSIHAAAKQEGVNIGIVSRMANFGKVWHGKRWMREEDYDNNGR